MLARLDLLGQSGERELSADLADLRVQLGDRMSGLPKIDLIPGWDCYDWRNARTILEHGHASEWHDIIDVLTAARLPHTELAAKGGSKTKTASALDSELYKRGWVEKKFETKIVVDGAESDSPTHLVDCFKGKIALEVEWNNKDPFYDRDLNNFRLLYDLRVADVGVVVTRSTSLMQWMPGTTTRTQQSCRNLRLIDHPFRQAGTAHSRRRRGWVPGASARNDAGNLCR